MSDNRNTTRRAVQLPIDVTVDGHKHSLIASNLSLGGAAIEGLKLPIETRVHVNFQIETLRINSDATVRWTSPTGIGVQFDGLRGAEVWELAKFLRKLPSLG